MAENWEISQSAFGPGRLPFLQAECIAESAEWSGLPEEAISFLQKAAAEIRTNPDLIRLSWHCHHTLFIGKSCSRSDTREWPLLTDLIGDHAGAFYLLIALSGVPLLRAEHKSRGIPDDISRDTCSDTTIWARQYASIGVERNGRFYHPGQPEAWGLDTRIFPWILSHLYGDLYRVGRLQYKIGPFRQRLRTYRHNRTRHLCMLAESGQEFRADGCYNGSGGISEEKGAWISELEESDTKATGFPINPEGRASRKKRSLNLSEWKGILQQDDPILEIHIPEDGSMDFDACGESLRRLIQFFPEHFPDRPFKGICCTSWLLDPAYQNLLSDRSNIVRFQRECFLFPLNSRGGRAGLERIFYEYAHDLSTAPRDTSMRRAVLDHLDAGGVLVSGGALIFPEHLEWGTQPYLQMPWTHG